MSEKTNISYANHTASPWFGCSEKSPGCTNCYSRDLTLKYKWAGWGDKAPRVRTKGFWKDVYKWNKRAASDMSAWNTFRDQCKTTDEKLVAEDFSKPHRPRVFPSLMDWLDAKVPIEWLAELLKVIYETPNLDWLLLTKRVEIALERLRSAMDYCHYSVKPWLKDWLDGNPPSNVWVGTSVEDQKRADERIPILLTITAKVRWLSVEPLLERVDLSLAFGWTGRGSGLKPPLSTALESLSDIPGISWCVVGGESGPKRRDCGVDAILNVADQCKAAGVPVWIKQDCALKPGQQGRIPDAYWAIKELPRL